MYGDPDELDRLARQLHGKAQDVRDAAADHQRAAADARWVSDAAAAYRDRVADDRRSADAAADALDAAADALSAHAAEVREVLARIAAMEQAVRDFVAQTASRARALAGDVVDGIGNVIEGAGHVVGNVVDGAGDALGSIFGGGDDSPAPRLPDPAAGLVPDVLPAPGSLEWLDLGDRLQRSGAF